MDNDEERWDNNEERWDNSEGRWIMIQKDGKEDG